MESGIELWIKSMHASLGVRVALNTDRLSRTFAGSCVGLGTLTTDRQAAQMTLASVGLDCLKTLQVDAQLSAKVAFDDIFAILDRLHDLGELLLRQVPGADRAVHFRPFEDLDRVDRSKAVNVAKSDVDPLFTGNVNTKDTWHNWEFLTLPLLVTRIRADHADHALPTNHLAVLAKLFN